MREVREETGYDVRLDRLLAVDSHVVPPERRLHGAGSGRALKPVRVLFAATVVGGALTAERDGTTDEARWFPVEEVPDLPHVSLVDVALRHLG